MSLLQVNDPRSRGRSKSPSGHGRDHRSRSRSRDSRRPSLSPSPSARVVAGSGSRSADRSRSRDSRRPRSRSRSRSRSRVRYDLSDAEEGGQRYGYTSTRARGREKDRYYHSGSENEDEGKGGLLTPGHGHGHGHGSGRGAAAHRRPSQIEDVSDTDSDSDDDDDGLAYGDDLGRRSPSLLSSSRLDTRGYGGGSRGRARSSSHLGDYSDHESGTGVGSHPSYANPGRFKYADPAQYMYPSGTGRLRGGSYSGAGGGHSNWAPIPECEMPGFVPPSSAQESGMPGAFPGTSDSMPYRSSAGYAPSQQRTSSDVPRTMYANPAPFQYAQVDPSVAYGSKTAAIPFAYSATPQFSKPQVSEPQYVEIAPGRRPSGRPHSLSVSSGNNLSVGGGLEPGRRPASPMLEPYKGTYQSISPMPSPIMSSSRLDEDVSDLEPLDASSESGRRKKEKKKSKDEKARKEKKSDRKRDRSSTRHSRQDSSGRDSMVLVSPSSRKKVSFYDPVPDAEEMRDALSHSRSIDTKTLINILPHLPSEDMLALRKEYKNHVKLHGKGINMAKHLRLKLGGNSFGKVCYATALGRWESEAYWANCYYQSSTSRRELLIESLTGRSNAEIGYIKNSFRDSRYMDSLEKCMKAELKADKFRTAILLSLEERRQSERDPIDPGLVREDVHELHHALMSRDGGETAMIYIIVLRSDNHLREILLSYENKYRRNFAREMIAKSQNLVGETLAHILNGAINRPMRDALLLHQALRESRTGKERSELLISRLVRLHWEPRHLEQVKTEFRKRYGERVEEAIAEEVLSTSGGSEWGEFCIELTRSSSV